MKPPKVSVVMPVFNSEKYLREAINSILSPTFKDFEFIIINDGSTDKTSSIINSYSDKRIRIISHSRNVGIVKSLNDGIELARGKYIARMDADDISHEKRLAIQSKYLDKHLKCGAVGSFTSNISDRGKLLFTIEPPTRHEAIINHLLHDSCIPHGSAMIRKSMLKKISGYSGDKQVIHAEDYDLFVRLAEICDLANIPSYLYTRHEHKNSISKKYSSIQSQSANHIRSIAKEKLRLVKKPKISVLMPTYNKARYISDAISSVCQQTFQDWELIIIDDGSADNTYKVVSKYLKDKRVIYLSNSGNLGKAKTRNRLLKESIGDIMCELDSDDVLSDDALAVIYSAHLSHKEAGFIYSQFEYCDEKLNRISTGFCRNGNEGETNLHNQYASALRSYKREAIMKTPGFDVNLDGAEDLDFIYKIEEVTSLYFVNKTLYKYRLTSGRNKIKNIPGVLSSIKSVYYSYQRRQKNGYRNMSFTNLCTKIINKIYMSIFG